jgi:hypothetical protein
MKIGVKPNEDRRQAKYKSQLARDNEMAKTDKEESEKEEQHTYDGHTYEVLQSPSPPRDLPQNFTRSSQQDILHHRKDGLVQQ